MSDVNRTPAAKRPGTLHPWAAVARAEEAAEDEARARAAAEREEFEREVEALRAANARVRIMLADVKFELALRALGRKYSQNQPRVPAGSREGGQWTSGGDGRDAGPAVGDAPQSGERLAQDQRSMTAPGPGQAPRRDLLELNAIANHPPIRARIDEAWAASDPNGFGREHGFWISRNDATGELFTRPFFNPGGPATIVPGPPRLMRSHPFTRTQRAPSLEDTRVRVWKTISTPCVRACQDCFNPTPECTILARCFDRADRLEAGSRCERPLVFKALILVAALQLTVDQAMPQPNCDVVKIAKDYARTRWPVDLTSDRRVIRSVDGNVWKVRFSLPDDTLGYVPEIGIDRRTCQVVSAILWQ